MRKHLYILKCIFPAVVYLALPNNLFGNDSLKTIRLRVGYDLSKPLYGLFNSHIKQHEVSIDIISGKKYYFPFEAGYSASNFERNNFTINIDGFYFRAGYNKKITGENTDFLSTGLRLAYTHYNLKYSDSFIEDFLFGPILIAPTPSKCHALWLEALVNIDVRIARNISFGWNIRAKLPLYFQKDNYFKPYYIPGYGKNNNSFSLGFNYMVYYTF